MHFQDQDYTTVLMFFQSGFQPHHRTVTSTNSGSISHAAFNMVSHNILLHRRENLWDWALNWFESCLKDRNHISEHTKTTCGVPQCSILGPLLFNVKTFPPAQIVNNMSCQNYADDTQVYMMISPRDYGPIQALSKSIKQQDSSEMTQRRITTSQRRVQSWTQT